MHVLGCVDRELLDGAAVVGGVEAVAALAEGDVVGLVDDAEDVAADAVGGEGLAGFAADARFINGDVERGVEFGGEGGAGVVRDDVHAGGAGFGESVAHAFGVAKRRRDGDCVAVDAFADRSAELFAVGEVVVEAERFDAEVQVGSVRGFVDGVPEDAPLAMVQDAVGGLAVRHQGRNDEAEVEERDIQAGLGAHLPADDGAGVAGGDDPAGGVAGGDALAELGAHCVGVGSLDEGDLAVVPGFEAVAEEAAAFVARIDVDADERVVALRVQVRGAVPGPVAHQGEQILPRDFGAVIDVELDWGAVQAAAGLRVGGNEPTVGLVDAPPGSVEFALLDADFNAAVGQALGVDADGGRRAGLVVVGAAEADREHAEQAAQGNQRERDEAERPPAQRHCAVHHECSSPVLFASARSSQTATSRRTDYTLRGRAA